MKNGIGCDEEIDLILFCIYTPEKLIMEPQLLVVCRYFSFSKEVFSGSMLVFGGALEVDDKHVIPLL